MPEPHESDEREEPGPGGGDAAAAFRDVGVLAVLSALLLWLARVRPFRGEEIEHVHAAWRVASGAVPYLDFFEHHHPLLWYVLGGALPRVGESGATILAFRMAFVITALVTLTLTGLLALEATGSRRIAWLAPILLGSTIAFLETSVAVRPDAPMVLFTTLSALLAIRALRTRRRAEAVAAGAALGIAFCFLQKAVLLLLALGVAGAIRRIAFGRSLPRATVGGFVLGLGAVVVAGGLSLALAGGLDDYFWSNWVFNGIVSAELARIPTTGAGLFLNLPFWVLATVGSGVVIARHRDEDALGTVALVGVTLLAALVAMRALRWHYLLQAMPMGAAVAAWALQRLFERGRLTSAARHAILLAVVVVPVVGLAHSLRATNEGQREAIDYVLERSAPDDAMFDPAHRFNLFRPDLHYFAEPPTDHTRVLDWYRRAAGRRVRGYDACRLLRERRPRFVSDAGDQLRACGLAASYGPTPFEGILARVD